MEAYRESKFMTAVFAALVFSTVVRLSDGLGGKISEQPWWGIALTAVAASGAAAFVWRMYRVYERGKLR
jgi:hypothetical protein